MPEEPIIPPALPPAAPEQPLPEPRVWHTQGRTVREGDRGVYFDSITDRFVTCTVICVEGPQNDQVRVSVDQTDGLTDVVHLDWIITAADGAPIAMILQRVATFRDGA